MDMKNTDRLPKRELAYRLIENQELRRRIERDIAAGRACGNCGSPSHTFCNR